MDVQIGSSELMMAVYILKDMINPQGIRIADAVITLNVCFLSQTSTILYLYLVEISSLRLKVQLYQII